MNWSVETKKKVCAILNYIEHFLTLASTVTGSISFSTFAFFLGVPIKITSSVIKLICAISTGLKKYKSILRKRKRSMMK